MLERLSYESRCKRELVSLLQKTVKESQDYIVIVVGAIPVGLQTATHASNQQIKYRIINPNLSSVPEFAVSLP